MAITTDGLLRRFAAPVADKVPRSVILLILLLLTESQLDAQTVEVTVSGIRSEKGQIAIGVFLDNESLRENKACKELQFPKQDMNDGTMKFSFSLGPGTYGLCLLDDEDNNRSMHYNFLGMPKEGFGFSDYYHTGLTKPSFDAFKFDLVTGQSKNIKIKVRYIL